MDNGFKDIPFPFTKIEVPDFEIRIEWSLHELAGYLNTWSAVQKFIAAKGRNPVPELIRSIV